MTGKNLATGLSVVSVACLMAGFVIGRVTGPSHVERYRLVEMPRVEPVGKSEKSVEATSNETASVETRRWVDVEVELDALMKKGGGAEIEAEALRLMASVRNDDIERMAEWAARQGKEGRVILLEAVRRWAEMRPLDAMAFCEVVTHSIQRVALMKEVLRAWARTDGKAACDWVMGLEDVAKRSLMMEWLAESVEWLDRNRQRKLAAGLPSRQAAVVNGAMFRAWFKEDAESARAAFGKLSGWQQAGVLDAVAWDELPVEMALEVLKSAPGSQSRTDAMIKVVREWAGKDLEAAMKWAAESSDAELRAMVLPQLVLQLARENPSAAARWAEKMPDAGLKNDLMAVAAREWLAQDVDQAITWARAISDPVLRGTMLLIAAQKLAPVAPRQAIELAGLAPVMTEEVASVIAYEYAKTSPLEAAMWAMGLADESIRQVAVSRLVSGWMERNEEEAGGWVQRLPVGSARDVALGAYARQLAHRDASRAMHWLALIGDETWRQTMVEQVVSEWMYYDRDTARNWVRFSSLPEEVKNRLMDKTVDGHSWLRITEW